MKRNLYIALFLILTIGIVAYKNIGDGINSPKRYGMVTGIKPEKIAYYKKLHAAAWPGVLKRINECNIRNYSIYLQKIEDKYYLFSYFEYTGNNFEADMKKMAADSLTRRWWKETDPTQLPLPQAAARHQQWQDMEEVFHTK
ncbi:MAG: L-rhamnose mutarotase [Sphingobacteriaceae bacterium]|nr:MAG: L-rhamnose mutarotase [Sphingobacteriaceae bacterium]